MPDYLGFFLDAPRSVIEFETLEISHPAFSQIYYVVRNRRTGLRARLETGVEVDFVYVPMRIRAISQRADLDFGLSVEFGDLGTIIPDEIDRVRDADALDVRPTVNYRTYRSDNLSTPMFGPLRLEVRSIPRSRDGASFEAGAPSLNLTRTGEVYSTTRFPMLRGYL